MYNRLDKIDTIDTIRSLVEHSNLTLNTVLPIINILTGNYINMAVLLWYLLKTDAIVRYFTVAYTGKVTFYKIPEIHGQG